MLSNLDSSPASAKSESLTDAARVQSSETEKRVFPPRWLPVLKGFWIFIFIFSSIFTVIGLPAEYRLRQTVCNVQPCHVSFQPTVQQATDMQNFGISLGNYALYSVALEVVSILIYFTLAWLVFWRRLEQPVPFLIGILFFTIGPNTTFIALEQDVSSPFRLPANILDYTAFLTMFLVFYLFPDGRFVPKWTARLVPVVALFFFVFYLLPYPDWLEVPLNLVYFLLLIGLIAAQIYRYFRVSTPEQKRQTKWMALGMGVVVGTDIITFLPYFFLPNLVSNIIYGLISRAIFTFILLILPVTMVIAVLQYKLWDIYPVINRTVVYILLSLSVVGIYILTVGILGAIFQTEGNFFISLLATALVAVGFHPVQAALQQVVNRLMYGERNQPYVVISRLGERLEKSVKIDEVLQTIVETVAQSLKLPFVSLALKQSENTGFVEVATYGEGRLETGSEKLVLPLVYQKEIFGNLQITTRTKGASFNPAELKLLNDLTRQAGVSLHAVQLTMHLQQERERLVKAREEERRRISRDLHDGLGPTMAGISLQLTTLQNTVTRKPEDAVMTLGEIKSQTQQASTDIRRLIYALHPPELELGLLTALKNLTVKHNQTNGLTLDLELPLTLPALPAALELAAYRISQEALNNITKHSQAKNVFIGLKILLPDQPKPPLVATPQASLISTNTEFKPITSFQTNYLELEISDDGIGFGEDYRSGVGLVSMRERVGELNGDWLVESVPQKGARLVILLPFGGEGEI